MGAPGTDPDPFDSGVDSPGEETGPETVLTTAADVESAGRSCMAILVLAVIILLLICVWIAFRTIGIGQ